jgi:endonuclease/exonuclease/phosphatase (EEP) superfamily protein YafD
VALGARRYWGIWVAVIPIVVWTAIRELGLDSGFPLVALMAFTPYVAIAAPLVYGVAAGLRNWAAAALAAAATFCLATAVLPRAVGDGTASAAGHETLTVLAANVYTGKADPHDLVALVRRLHPDVLSVEELTPRFVRELDAAGIARQLPHRDLAAYPGAAGAGLYSRLPLTALPGATRFFFRMPRARLRLPGGRSIGVVAVHPHPPQSDYTGVWEEGLASLPSAGSGMPWVLAGDFNATLDQSAFRDLLGRGYRDSGDVAGDGLAPTFPRAFHLIPPVTIDHVLADRRLGIASYSLEEVPGSDHRAVAAELVMP